MKLNENIAISSPKVLLVPYDRRHVPRYHEWMKDPAIQEATASEPLSLEEEYENQESWRASHDKLTFILCQPTTTANVVDDQSVDAGKVDAPGQMIGDINFFLYPSDDDDAPDGTCVGEVDIMIAGQGDRGKGLGKAAVSTFLHYIWKNRDEILREYQAGETGLTKTDGGLRLEVLMAKIKSDNKGSIALFKGLGFEQDGDVNYFGEIKMVLKSFDCLEKAPEGFQVVKYRRS
ncbi:hypothetical protein N0V93_006660 [Gnomoniopsis smithogilvyi]|uniref:N-acetyltransferase domain-containing protein n=1 Tax=Gnomoniopsis smithogilvyi TaxID=1191159 RepID=A0A9W9CVX7_9PEZI|nr:hypothetical protein N0V93_006660 [Gnomoniopsis smithogilvyi]